MKNVTKAGYIRRYVSGGRKEYEHRLVAEQMLGRKLSTSEQVHHRNGVKVDNRPENLEVWENSAHQAIEQGRLQGTLPLNGAVACRCGCGQLTPEFDAKGRPRRGFVTGHNGWRKGQSGNPAGLRPGFTVNTDRVRRG